MNTYLMIQKALDRLDRHGVGALSEQERVLATVWLFDAGISNGGFARYFSSAKGNLALYAPAALRAIGATHAAKLAAEANALFGPSGPPMDRDERQRRLHDLPETTDERFTEWEQRFSESDEDLDLLLEHYVSTAPSHE